MPRRGRIQSGTGVYQLIYATSYITDERNNSPYVVGDFYTKDKVRGTGTLIH